MAIRNTLEKELRLKDRIEFVSDEQGLEEAPLALQKQTDGTAGYGIVLVDL